MKKGMLFAALLIVAMSAIAQDVAKKGCEPKACKPGNTKVEEAAVITELRMKVVGLSEQVAFSGIKSQDLVGSTEDESLALISNEVKRLCILLQVPAVTINSSGAKLISQLQSIVERLTIEANRNEY